VWGGKEKKKGEKKKGQAYLPESNQSLEPKVRKGQFGRKAEIKRRHLLCKTGGIAKSITRQIPVTAPNEKDLQFGRNPCGGSKTSTSERGNRASQVRKALNFHRGGHSHGGKLRKLRGTLVGGESTLNSRTAGCEENETSGPILP